MNDLEISRLLENRINLQGNFSGIYFLFDNEELVYIGKGWNCLLRIAKHTRKDSFKKFTSWNFIRIDDKNEYNRIEKELINKFKPKYNRTHIK